jgi:hypothetical protein
LRGLLLAKWGELGGRHLFDAAKRYPTKFSLNESIVKAANQGAAPPDAGPAADPACSKWGAAEPKTSIVHELCELNGASAVYVPVMKTYEGLRRPAEATHFQLLLNIPYGIRRPEALRLGWQAD